MIAVFGDEFPHSQVGQLSDQVVALSIVHGEHPGLWPVLVSRSLLEEVSCLPCRDLDCLLEQTIFLLDVSDISPSHYNLSSRDGKQKWWKPFGFLWMSMNDIPLSQYPAWRRKRQDESPKVNILIWLLELWLGHQVNSFSGWNEVWSIMRCIDEARKQGGQAPSDRCILGQARDLASMCKNSSSPMYIYTDHQKM